MRRERVAERSFCAAVNREGKTSSEALNTRGGGHDIKRQPIKLRVPAVPRFWGMGIETPDPPARFLRNCQPVSRNLRRSRRIPFEPDPVIDSVLEALSASEVSLGCLHREVLLNASLGSEQYHSMNSLIASS